MRKSRLSLHCFFSCLPFLFVCTFIFYLESKFSKKKDIKWYLKIEIWEIKCKLKSLECTTFKKISSNPKIGIFCDVTAYRISLFWACFENFCRNFNLSIMQPPFNSKERQNNPLWNLWKIKNGDSASLNLSKYWI